MTDEEWQDQEALLAAHRQTLHALLMQQSRMQDYTPPHVVTGIAEARHAIAQIKALGRTAGRAVPDRADDDAPTAAAVAGTTPRLAGDVITGIVGAGAQHVAIGKQITMVHGTGDTIAHPEAALEQFGRALDAANLPPPIMAMQMVILRAELTRQPPDVPNLVSVGAVLEALAALNPATRPAIAALLATPAIAGALQRGGATAAWLARWHTGGTDG